MSDQLKIIISGAKGRMGSLILKQAQAAPDLLVAGQAENDQPLENIVEAGDVVIDFSVREAAGENALTAARHHKPIVIGTTGLDAQEELEIRKAAEVIPIVYAPNMSAGVNLLWQMAAMATRILAPDFKIEIVEEHHVHKKDRPSGTAQRMLDLVLKESGFDRERDLSISEEIFPADKSGYPVSVCSVRKGETVGDHTIRFVGAGETIEITHRALGREIFAQGALAAARWVKDKKAGLYSMADVLGLKEK